MVTIADCPVIDEPFRFQPESVHVSAYPSLSIPPELVVGAVCPAFKLVKPPVDENRVVFNWRLQTRQSGSDFAGRLRR